MTINLYHFKNLNPMLKNLIYGTLLSVAVLFASCSGNQNNNNSGNNQASSNQTTTAAKGTPEDIWRAYLQSNLTDLPAKVTDLDKAMKNLKKFGPNATRLIIDNQSGNTWDSDSPEYNAVMMAIREGSDDSGLDFYYETMAIFDNNDGSQTILLESSHGRQMVSLLSYKNGTLTRLKNQLPFGQHYLLENPESDGDNMISLKGSEVDYLDYDVSIDWDNTNSKGIQMINGDEPGDFYKWNGEKFQ